MVMATGLMLLGAACGSSSNDTSSGTTTTAGGQTTTTAPQTTTTAGSSSTTSGASGATVTVAQTSKGSVLVGPNGHTLYIFDKDNGTTSACMASCAPTWPALGATGTPTAGDGVDDSKLSTANGQVANQVVYNGHLLYFFAGDSDAGQVNGASIPGWHAVTADGNAAP
jgi:predicted lipoprotein with Yx(FWY)xxD motif